ncbi:signal recognition particle-docking protein FtsY [Corynebacterium sp.]|uniref:signal recognition particle-docking protein FtsY n=1 Tax=Corynebacterium sp. TaxID=1720 RepID=UPI0026DD4AC8|nr:signal recognition particle-docking protein FtsY [Corynebacterium sp.]MDO5031458.1 signal recognition particle-docking protein FtsY [Corynebacterium sp.]
MNSTVLWILIALIVVVALVVLLVTVGKKRGESKKVSFEKPAEEPKQLTQEQKSGNYQAKSGFNFAPAGGGAQNDTQKEPVRVDKAPTSGKAAEAPKAEDKPAQPNATKIANQQLAGEKPQKVEEPAKPAKPAAPVEDAPVKKEEPVQPVKQEAEAADQPAAPVEDSAEEKPVEETAQVETTEPESAEPESIEEEAEQEEPVPAAPVEEADAAEAPAGQDATAHKQAESEAPVTEEELAQAEATEAAAAASAQAASADEALATEPEQLEVSEDAEVVEAPEQPKEPQEQIAPAAGRLGKLRGRLSRSQNAIGQGLMGILSAGDLDEDAWEEIEDTLIMADLGTKSTLKVTELLRDKIAERGVSSEDEARAMLREALIEVGHPEMDRSIKAMPNEGKPAVIMVVGVNGTGKTTTTGKLARVLVSMGHNVLLGAADTFRAAAADQLETWGRRVGASTVRGKEGADPASVAFDAVAAGVERGVDVVLIDTAGRLHTSVDLMDQLGKVKRVVEKKTDVDEVLLVLDATVGQNGLAQARIFREVVDITGVVLTKLDGTAKGGIVFQVQEELGVPVKLVGLGEGADDLAPFEVEGFVDALLGER